MSEPKTEKSRRTRETLLRETAQLFSTHGYAATSVDDVMKKAGLTKGGFYAHFASKEDLGRAVIEYATALWMEKVLAGVAGVEDPRAQLRALFDGYRGYAESKTFQGGCFFVNLATELDDVHDAFRAQIAELFLQFRMLVAAIVDRGKEARVFRRDVSAEAVAAIAVAHLTGLMLQAKLEQSFAIFQDANATMLAMLDGLLMPPAKPPRRRKKR